MSQACHELIFFFRTVRSHVVKRKTSGGFMGILQPGPASSTPSARRLHAVCTPSARRQHAVSTPSARRQHAVSTPSARRLHAVCTPSARRQHAVCTPSARRQHAVCTPSARRLHRRTNVAAKFFTSNVCSSQEAAAGAESTRPWPPTSGTQLVLTFQLSGCYGYLLLYVENEFDMILTATGQPTRN